MIQFTKLFNKSSKKGSAIKLNSDSIAAKHSYYLKQKQMKPNTDVITGVGKLFVIAMLIVLAGYVGSQVFASTSPLLDNLQARYDRSNAEACIDERELARGKVIAYRTVSKEVHEALKISLEKQGLVYNWNTPEGFIDMHLINDTEEHIRELEEKADWTCEEDVEDFQ